MHTEVFDGLVADGEAVEGALAEVEARDDALVRARRDARLVREEREVDGQRAVRARLGVCRTRVDVAPGAFGARVALDALARLGALRVLDGERLVHAQTHLEVHLALVRQAQLHRRLRADRERAQVLDGRLALHEYLH